MKCENLSRLSPGGGSQAIITELVDFGSTLIALGAEGAEKQGRVQFHILFDGLFPKMHVVQNFRPVVNMREQ